MIRSATISVTIVLMMNAAIAAEGPHHFSCNGNLIEPTSLAPSPISIRLTLGSAHKVSINLGKGDSSARVVSDNKIQLKFQTKEFVGEFFHYTSDLFLIYKSGHLAKLTCMVI